MKNDIVEQLKTLKKAIDKYSKHGMSIVDDPNQGEEDEADNWLAEHGTKNKETTEPSRSAGKSQDTKSHSAKEWTPRSDLAPHQAAVVKQYVDQGFSPREAERLAGFHKGTRDYKAALKSNVAPSMPSDKMLSNLKALAGEWIQNARLQEMSNADEIDNPLKHAAGQVINAHKESTKDYEKAYSDFLESGDIKDLKGRDRHKAIQTWKENWKKENPSHEENLDNAASKQSKFSDAAQNIKQKGEEISQHIARGGISQVPEMSDKEAMQHLGGGKGEEGYTTGSIVKDPLANFASKNPQYAKMLNKEQMDRLNRVNSAAAMQGKVRTIKKPEEPKG